MNPTIPATIEFDSEHPIEYIEFMKNRMAIIHNQAIEAQRSYDEKRKEKYDKKHKKPSFQIGQLVIYDIANRLSGNIKKFTPNYIGPFEITSIHQNEVTITLQEVAVR